MAQTAGFGRKYVKAFVSGFFVAVPVTVTVLDRLAYVARVEGASMQPSLNPQGSLSSDVVLLNRWSVRNYEVQRGDIVSVVTLGYKNRYVRVPDGHLWIEGDHQGHSFDSNTFGPVSLGLLHGRASHIIWPPNRWQRIRPRVPNDRRPIFNGKESTEDDNDDDDDYVDDTK
ncbi:mitochondrial inner membrane protease subunit 2 isoform X3 [Tachysurus fulvidraco]|uniref:mitochondrial inner membrane protease subunit 2 isoform X3 n=1 Tax=Tachysurus fulvidraco TaxID=1234273 RepID=UPI000F4D3AED|nr:mitochondrial inner membrane protease subunit 2 isoform X3 [Tachysurus fulvidraco]